MDLFKIYENIYERINKFFDENQYYDEYQTKEVIIVSYKNITKNNVEDQSLKDNIIASIEKVEKDQYTAIDYHEEIYNLITSILEQPITEEVIPTPEVKDNTDSNRKLIEEFMKTQLKNQGQFPPVSRGRAPRAGRAPPQGAIIKAVKDAVQTAMNSESISPIKKMEELIKNDPKLKEKLIKFLERNKAGGFYVSSLKRSFYISRPNLNKMREIYLNEKEGGFLPLIPILAGIAAAGSVAGGAAGIASAVNKKKAEDAALKEQQRHNISLEDAARGKGLKDDVVKFIENNDLDNDVKRLVKKTLKGLASVIPMRSEGGSLILTPYRKDGGSLLLNLR